jgi:hypothetical protein
MILECATGRLTVAVNKGDVVKVVLDVVPETDSGERYSRVFVRGIYELGAPEPELLPGASRNSVQVFLGYNHDLSAFRISCGPEELWSPDGGAGERQERGRT